MKQAQIPAHNAHDHSDRCRLLFQVLRVDRPIRIAFQLTIVANEHLGGSLIVFELSVEPSEGNGGVFATVRPTVGSSVPDV